MRAPRVGRLAHDDVLLILQFEVRRELELAVGRRWPNTQVRLQLLCVRVLCRSLLRGLLGSLRGGQYRITRGTESPHSRPLTSFSFSFSFNLSDTLRSSALPFARKPVAPVGGFLPRVAGEVAADSLAARKRVTRVAGVGAETGVARERVVVRGTAVVGGAMVVGFVDNVKSSCVNTTAVLQARDCLCFVCVRRSSGWRRKYIFNQTSLRN